MIEYDSMIYAPVITEKLSFLREKFNKYAMYVSVGMKKSQIKLAIESLFDVKVSSINVMRVKPKVRRFKGIVGRKKHRKKVYFSLVGDQKLDIMSV